MEVLLAVRWVVQDCLELERRNLSSLEEVPVRVDHSLNYTCKFVKRQFFPIKQNFDSSRLVNKLNIVIIRTLAEVDIDSDCNLCSLRGVAAEGVQEIELVDAHRASVGSDTGVVAEVDFSCP